MFSTVSFYPKPKPITAMPKAKSKVRTRGAASKATTSKGLPDLPSSDVDTDVQPVPAEDVVEESDAAGEQGGTSGPTSETVPKPLGRRKKGSQERHFLFTEEQEDNLIDWWREHEYFYNSKHPSHKDKGLKDRLYRAKAAEFGCTSKYKLQYEQNVLMYN